MSCLFRCYCVTACLRERVFLRRVLYAYIIFTVCPFKRISFNPRRIPKVSPSILAYQKCFRNQKYLNKYIILIWRIRYPIGAYWYPIRIRDLFWSIRASLLFDHRYPFSQDWMRFVPSNCSSGHMHPTERWGCHCQRQQKSAISFVLLPSASCMTTSVLKVQSSMLVQATIFPWNHSPLDTFQSRISGGKHNKLIMLLQCCRRVVFCTKEGRGLKFPEYHVMKIPIFSNGVLNMLEKEDGRMLQCAFLKVAFLRDYLPQ